MATVSYALIFVGAGLPEPVTEHRFAQPRRFAFDFAWPSYKVALEVEGGLFGKGKPCPLCGRRQVAGHGSIERIKSDMAKYNLASILGWRVIRVLPEELNSGKAFTLAEQALKSAGWNDTSTER